MKDLVPGQLLGSPSARDTLESMTFRDGNTVDHLVLLLLFFVSKRLN